MLAELLHLSRVNVHAEPPDKDAAIRMVAALLVQPDQSANEDSVCDVLAERERLASTGVGSGVAIPHGRFDGIEELRAAVAVCKAGVDFEAVDGLPVHILVGIVGPRSMPQHHLAALAGVSRALRDEEVRAALLAAKDDAEAFSILTES
ncbi:MAG: PTS sugar transporter subunit IIA [Myxococcota bacterium]